MSIGTKIRERRLELKLSQEELARMVGYTSRATINKIEVGTRGVPMKKLSVFAKVLSVSIEWLLVDLDDKDDENFIKSLGELKPLCELDEELQAVNIFLREIGEHIIRVDGNIYLGECGMLTEEEIAFIKTSIKISVKGCYDILRSNKMKELPLFNK